MTERDNTNRGAIWKNTEKQSDNHPDFKGELDVGGRKYWVSAWKRREDASPKAPALSFSIKPKEGQPRQGSITQRAQAAMQRQRGDSNEVMDDEIPF